MSSASVEVDHSKPRNLISDLFSDLPPESTIPKKQDNHPKPKKNKYQQSDGQGDDQIFHLDLGMESKIVGVPDSQQKEVIKINKQDIKANNDNKPKVQMQSKIRDEGKIGAIGQGPIRLHKKKPSKQNNKTNSKQKQIVIDDPQKIDEVYEWQGRNTRANAEQDDFDDDSHPKELDETQQKLEIRKKIQQKIKSGTKATTGGLKGLQAKADELRRKNQQKMKQEQSSEIQLNKDVKQANNSQKVQNKSIAQVPKKIQKPEEPEDDPWQKVNHATINKYSNQQNRVITEQDVVKYYKEEMIIDFADLDAELTLGEGEDEEEQEQGWVGKLCACLSKKSQKKSKNKTEPTGRKEALRLLAISKIQLTNTDYQFFLLKEIWTLATHKPFARYGNHWNQIGFQGRDPATDLRSTGILSLLQLYLYIKKHTKFAQKQRNWTVEFQFPWALTHIKVSGLFLELLRKGAISGTWQQLQNWYNALSYGMFTKVMAEFKQGEIGTIVEAGIKQMKGNWLQQKVKYQRWVKAGEK